MRRGFTIDKYLEITSQDTPAGSGVRFLQGTSAPGGDAGEQDAASIGSIFSHTGTGVIYRKVNNVGALADWEALGNVNLSNLVWRQEKVRFATGDVLTAGTFDITTLTDNDDMVIGNITIGEYCLGDIDGTPALFEITAKPAGNTITIAAASIALADNNTFVVQQYLPDPTGQENAAILHFPTSISAGIKLSDFDWALADGITLNGYSDTTGAVVGTDTVQIAIQKIEKGLKDVISLTGEARNSVNFTAFSSPASLLINGTTATIRSAFQRIFDLYAQLRGVQVTGITTSTLVDSVIVDNVNAVKWLVEAFEIATPANKQAFEVYALHDGTPSADAVTPDWAVAYKLKTGANFDLTVNVDVNGVGAAQVMRLMAASSTAGVTVTARRIEVVKNVL